MRVAALALVSALAIVACSPKAPANGASGAPAASGASNPGGAVGNLFPNLFQASYRAEANIIRSDGQTMPVVIVRSGQNFRMEMNGPQGHMAIIRNNDTHDTFSLMQMGGRQIAMRVDTGAQNPLQADPMQMWAERQGVQVTRGGPCASAGLTGNEWTTTRAREGGAPVSNTACVTGDGIILQAKEGERVTWQTTSVQRGPQDPAQFALPPGVQVMNLGNAGALLSQLRNGAKPAGQ